MIWEILNISDKWILLPVAFVAGIIVYAGYLFWYHLIKYPNGKPKSRKL